VQGTSHFIFLRSGLYIWSRTVRLEIVRTEKGTSLWAVPLFKTNLKSGLSSQVHHMNVSAKPYVIRQIPTLVVGVVIDHNVVAVPQPAITESHVRRCDVPVPSVEPKTSGATTAEVPNMVATESAGEVSVLPRFVEMQAKGRSTVRFTQSSTFSFRLSAVGKNLPNFPGRSTNSGA